MSHSMMIRLKGDASMLEGSAIADLLRQPQAYGSSAGMRLSGTVGELEPVARRLREAGAKSVKLYVDDADRSIGQLRVAGDPSLMATTLKEIAGGRLSFSAMLRLKAT